jgi:hypothetical protein
VIPLVTIAAYASAIAGTPIQIACDIPPASPYDGFVYFPGGIPERVIHLRPGICIRLEHADTSLAIAPSDFLVLTHEAMHIATGSLDECGVERLALANVWQLVRLFRLAAWRVNVILGGAGLADASMPDNPYHEGC